MNQRFHNCVVLLLSAVVLGWIFYPAPLNAAEANIQATLSESTTEVGQAVELQIEVTGAHKADPPPNLSVDGLTFGSVSQSTQQSFNFINGSLSSSSSTSYSIPVIPQRSGTFTIPALTMEVDGKRFTTRPLTLTVSGGGGGSAGTTAGAGPSEAPENNGIASAELVVPKQIAYVGEAIPIEIRVYFDARVRIQANEMPTLQCPGFTVQKLTHPRQDQMEKNGKRYAFLTYKTAITPVKSGKLSLGPVELGYIALIPQARRAQRPHFGGMDDFFNDDLFSGMLGGGYTQQQFTVKSGNIDLEVKPLPRLNQPKSFSGAVGQFSLTTEASPLKLNIGDPITIKLKVTGRGNFDLVAAPHIRDEAGWRSYPASNKFTPDDDVGISGAKIFEMAVIPDDKKTKLPSIDFTYFDPASEKYVSLTADRLPIVVEGQTSPVAVSQTSPVSAGQSPPPTEKAHAENDIHYIATGQPRWGNSFAPLYAQPEFWKAQAAPFLLLMGFAGFQVRAKRKQDLVAKQLEELRKEKAGLLKTLQRDDLSSGEFYDCAARYIQVEAARGSGRIPATISVRDAVNLRSLDTATIDTLNSIFNAHSESRYAGVSTGNRKLTPEQRRTVLEAIRKFEDANQRI